MSSDDSKRCIELVQCFICGVNTSDYCYLLMFNGDPDDSRAREVPVCATQCTPLCFTSDDEDVIIHRVWDANSDDACAYGTQIMEDDE